MESLNFEVQIKLPVFFQQLVAAAAIFSGFSLFYIGAFGSCLTMLR